MINTNPVATIGCGHIGNIPQTNPYLQQSAQAQQQAYQNLLNPQRANWVVDGEMMSFDKFVTTVFPLDTPERTMFLLRYSGEK